MSKEEIVIKEATDLKHYKEKEMTDKKVHDLIKNKESFTIVGVHKMAETVRKLEDEMDRQKFRSRVYTAKRSAALASFLVPTGIGQVVGAATALGLIGHNLATFNPDFEIVKHKIKDWITVKYKKN